MIKLARDTDCECADKIDRGETLNLNKCNYNILAAGALFGVWCHGRPYRLLFEELECRGRYISW